MCASQYDYIKIIGRGGFGKVWKVKRKIDNKIFAIKVMQKARIFEKHSVENIYNEKKIMENINHP